MAIRVKCVWYDAVLTVLRRPTLGQHIQHRYHSGNIDDTDISALEIGEGLETCGPKIVETTLLQECWNSHPEAHIITNRNPQTQALVVDCWTSYLEAHSTTLRDPQLQALIFERTAHQDDSSRDQGALDCCLQPATGHPQMHPRRYLQHTPFIWRVSDRTQRTR